jgi:hypothetical protein
MKPWFEREAKIIKFPEPKAKVVELPNVQSYPDFLTGVKDLHNRKDRGEISQASHDKLYTDLIHRFMKKESFETPWFLRENIRLDEGITDKLQWTLDVIKNDFKEIGSKVIAFIKKLNPFSKKQSKPQSDVQVPPGADAQPSPTGNMQNNLESLTEQDATSNPGLSYNLIEKALKSSSSLADKVFTFLLDIHAKPKVEKIKHIIDAKVKNQTKLYVDTIKSNLAVAEILRYPFYKKIPGAFDTLESGVLGADTLTKSKSGWVNVVAELKSKFGDPQYMQILEFNNLILRLNNVEENVKGKSGKGEAFLQHLFGASAAGQQEGASGDIKIGNENWEVKSNYKKANVNAVSSATLAGRDSKEPLQNAGQYLQGILETQKAKLNTKNPSKIFTFGRNAELSWNNFNTKNWTNLMNKFIGVESKTHNNMAHEVVVTFLNKLYGQKLPKKAENYLTKATTKSWNAGLFSKAFFMSNANYYYMNKKFDGIIFINNKSGTQNDMLIKAIDGNDLVNKIDKGEIEGRTHDLNAIKTGELSGQPGAVAK